MNILFIYSVLFHHFALSYTVAWITCEKIKMLKERNILIDENNQQ